MARSMGIYAEGPVTRSDELEAAQRRALEAVKNGQSTLVDVFTQNR